MKYLDISDQNTLEKLLEEIAASHEEIIITRDGVGIAIILPFSGFKPEDKIHPLQGKPIYISDDFDEPTPELWGSLGE